MVRARGRPRAFLAIAFLFDAAKVLQETIDPGHLFPPCQHRCISPSPIGAFGRCVVDVLGSSQSGAPSKRHRNKLWSLKMPERGRGVHQTGSAKISLNRGCVAFFAVNSRCMPDATHVTEVLNFSHFLPVLSIRWRSPPIALSGEGRGWCC